MTDKYHVYRPLLDLIGKAEGTDAPRGRGYDETLGYGAYTGGPVSLTTMTLGEIDRLQTQMLQHPRNTWNSSAIGRYQIVRTTLRRIKKALSLSDGLRFTPDRQDQMACYLLGGRGVDRWLSGAMAEDTFINELAKEWASFPTTRGVGYYGNQSRTPITPNDVRNVLRDVRLRYERRGPAEPAPSGEIPTDNWLVTLLKLIFGVR